MWLFLKQYCWIDSVQLELLKEEEDEVKEDTIVCILISSLWVLVAGPVSWMMEPILIGAHIEGPGLA